MTEALLFDFNGVLVDDEEQHYQSLQTVLAEEGITLTRDAYYQNYLGYDDRTGVVEAFRRANRTLTSEQLAVLAAAKARMYEELIAGSLKAVAGAADFVRGAADRYRLAVVSGALRREVERGLNRLRLRQHFETIIAAEDVPQCKPDPAGFLAAHAALSGRRPLAVGRCVVLEDSLPGLEAARAAGMPCVMLATSHPRAALAGADLVWDSFTAHDPAQLAALGTG